MAVETKARAVRKKPARPTRPREHEQEHEVEPPVPRLHGTNLSTGLVDYAMWVDLFGDKAPDPPTYRRGRIWA